MRKNELNLTDKQIAKLAASFCYSAKFGKEALATIWLVEDLVLPVGVTNRYTEKDMERMIMEAIKDRDNAKNAK